MADISQDLVVTASSDGVVIVRNRETLGSVYRATHHGDQAVVGLRVVEDLVLTSTRRELVLLRHRTRTLGEGRQMVRGEYMELVQRLDNVQLDGSITCLDSDRETVVTGTTKYLIVWSILQDQTSSRLETGFLTSVLLHSPVCLTVGTSPSVQVWNIASGELLTSVGNNYYRSSSHTSHNTIAFSSQLVFNGRFLAATESQRSHVHRNVVFFNRFSYRGQVTLMDIQGSLQRT